jgi:hypothetical protein
VGIGTGALWAPAYKLHINNGANVASIMAESYYTSTAQRAIGYFRVQNSATGDIMNISLRKNGAVHEMLQSCYDAGAGAWREYSYFNYGTRKFEMRAGILDAEFLNSGNFLLSNTGNVGIKVASPTAHLHVAEIDDQYTALFGTDLGTGLPTTNDVTIGNDNGNSLIYMGQSSTRKAFMYWDYDPDPDLAYWTLGTYNGTNSIVLQEVGGNVGIRTTTPDALLDIYSNENNYVLLGYNDVYANYFYHREDPADGDGQSAIYANRSQIAASSGISYGNTGTNSAIKGYSVEGEEYTFGTCGYNFLTNNTRCGGVLGASTGATWWGSLGYVTSGISYYGGYFTSSGSGSGKGREDAHNSVGIGAWGDLFGADIHGTIYGTYTEGENYALYSHGISYKDNLDVHLQQNEIGDNTVMYTHVSTDATIQTSGVATLSAGRASVAFDPAFSSVLSSEEPVIVTVTPIGESNGVHLSEVTGEGFTVVENNAGKSNITVNYIAIGKRAGYERPQLAKEVIDAGYVNKLSRGLHNDNDLETDGEGLYYENGELVVGVHPTGYPEPEGQSEKIIKKQESREYSPDSTDGAGVSDGRR